MLIWPQGKILDDYTKQILTLLGQRGIPYSAVKVYVPDPWCAYWDYNLFFKNHQGQPTGLLVGPYVVQGAKPADIIDMALASALPEAEQLERRDWSLVYSYDTHLGPFGLYGEIRPNRIKEAGIYLGWPIPPATFGTPPPIPPPPMVEQPKPSSPAPAVQQPGQGTTPDASGIAAIIPSAPPVALGMAEVLAFLLKADPQTIALIQMLLAMKK